MFCYYQTQKNFSRYILSVNLHFLLFLLNHIAWLSEIRREARPRKLISTRLIFTVTNHLGFLATHIFYLIYTRNKKGRSLIHVVHSKGLVIWIWNCLWHSDWPMIRLIYNFKMSYLFSFHVLLLKLPGKQLLLTIWTFLHLQLGPAST
jgi:hypothetical protein